MGTEDHRFVRFLRDTPGQLYRDLIAQHIRRAPTAELAQAAMGETRQLPKPMFQRAEAFIDELNSAMAADQAFWASASCEDAYSRVARVATQSFGIAVEPDVLLQDDPDLAFALFQVATLNFAYSASSQPAQQAFMGIVQAKRFPIWSSVGVAYGLLSGLVLFFLTPAGPIGAIGYGLSQLGYVLIASGILTGSFLAFGLTGRAKVNGAGVAVLALGVIITNA